MLGFLIISHKSKVQLLGLVDTLNTAYDNPPIACHHDFGQNDFPIDDFPSNVHFVLPSVRTGWAKWPVVDAELRALRLLYERANPEWFVLLSAADYPIKPAKQVYAELKSTDVDAFIDYRQVGDNSESAKRFGPKNPELDQFESEGNRTLKWRFYVAAQIWVPIVRYENGKFRVGRHTIRLPFEAPGNPFDTSFKCFHGDHWFTANRKVAQILLNPTPTHLALQRHLKWRAIPEECYYQTVLCNSGLNLHRDNKRFAKWNGGGAHPQELTMAELPLIQQSGAHFARKFPQGADVLDAIRETLLGS